MNSPQLDTNPVAPETVHVQAHYSANRKLGHWTTGRRFEVKAMRGLVLLDLRSPQIPEGDIEIDVMADHAVLKLLVPDDAVIDSWDLKQVGRVRVKDFPGRNPEGRRIKITGEYRHGEIRVRRGGIATLTAMFTREYAEDVYRAHKEGTVPTLDNPAITAPGTPRPARTK